MEVQRFPRLAGYLESLPKGLASYPECRAKGSIFRTAFEGRAWNDEYATLPLALRTVLEEPPLPNAWIPETVSVAAHHAVADVEGMTDEGVIAWGEASLGRLARSPMYRVVSFVASPQLLLKSAPLSWKLLHQGMTLRVQTSATAARLELEHPAKVWTELVHRVTAAAFRTIIGLAGGQKPTVELARVGATGGVYEAAWGVS